MRYGRNIESGVVLTMVLMVLLVITLLSITTLNTSSMQLLIARNSQLQQLAFHDAENSVRAAEQAWDAALDSCLGNAACSVDITPPVIDHIDSIDWDAITDRDAAERGSHVIEYLGWRPVPGDSSRRLLFYRFTARGVSPGAGAVAYVQTLYRKCINKDGTACSRQ